VGEGSCEACPLRTYSNAEGADNADFCLSCAKDSAPLVEQGATSCTQCPNGLISVSGIRCFLGTVCKEGEYKDGGDCKKCNDFFSFLVLGFCLISLLALGFYVKHISMSRTKMLRVKVLSTFFQIAELTTMIEISWPKFVILTLPFQMPVADSQCLASASGTSWGFDSTFYCYIYGPTFVFGALALAARLQSKNSPNRIKLATTLSFLVTLWYSPVLKICSEVLNCATNEEGVSVLVADPKIACTSTTMLIMRLHGALICAFVGVGLPVWIYLRISQLQKMNALDANAPISSLFKWYNAETPWFEAVHLIRRGLLIATGSMLKDALAQSSAHIVVNLGFLVTLVKLRPLFFFPCSLLKKYGEVNLFFLSESLGATAATLGSVLAFVGAIRVWAIP
jgi:hypothetical protein